MIYLLLSIFIGFVSSDVPAKCDTFLPRYTQSYQDVKDCIDSMPFDPEVRDSSINAMLDFLDLYIYRDINLDTGPPYNIQQDTVGRIEKLRDKTYDRDYDFQKELQEIVGDVKDAHTCYMPPLCFGGYTVALPFAGSSKLVPDPDNEGEFIQKLYVKESRLTDIEANYTRIYPDLSDYTTKYIGWEILEIDEEDAMDRLYDYALFTNTYSRDKAVRFNDALEQFFMHSCMRERFPDTSSVKFKLKSPEGDEETIDAKYVVYPLFDIEQLGWEYLCGYGGLSSGPSLFRRSTDEMSNMLLDLILDPKQKQLSMNHGLTIPIIEEHIKYRLTSPKPSYQFDPLYIFHREKKKMEEKSSLSSKKENLRRSSEDDDDDDDDYSHRLYEPVEDVEGPDIFSYIRLKNTSDDKLTGVLQVRNFYPASFDLIWKWSLDVHKSLEEFKDRGVERIVVDLRKNGGGILCLGWMLVKYLSAYAPEAMYPFGDMRSTEFWRRFFCKNNIFGYMFMFVDDEIQPNPSTFITDEIQTEKNGHVANYSHLIAPECTIFRYMYIDDILNSGRDLNESPMQFEPEDIILLTDGKCGSTCGMVVKLVQLLGLGRIVSQGGYYDTRDEDMAVASFKGASVMMSTPLYQQIDFSLGCLLLCDCKRLHVLPGFQMVTFSWLEMFTYDALTVNDPMLLNRTDPLPAEYHRKAADHHIWNWDFDLDFGDEFVGVIELVLPYFEGCYDWEVRRDDQCSPSSGKGKVVNGVYGNPCNEEGTGYVDDECVLRGCEPGFYYSKLDMSSEDGLCLEMIEEFNMAKLLMQILSLIACCFTAFTIMICCGFCICYLCLFGGFGWGCFVGIRYWQNRKYGLGKKKERGGGYINVIDEEDFDEEDEEDGVEVEDSILDDNLPPPQPTDEDKNMSTRVQFDTVEPLLGESSINI